MRRYLDTSLLVAVLIREAGTPAAKSYLASCGDRPLLISRWVIAEFSSALAIKVRTCAITTSEKAAALMMFRRFSERRLRVLNIGAGDFAMAASMCDQSAIPLWAGDALHLAVCVRVTARVATFDGGLATAAQHHGVATDFLTVQQHV